MTLVQHKGRWMFKFVIYAILFVIIDMYYLHITNHNPALEIASKNFLFVMTSLFWITLLILGREFFKITYNEKHQEQAANIFGYLSLMMLCISFVILKGTETTWLSDLFIQIIVIAAIGSIVIMPKKANYAIPVMMIVIASVTLFTYLYCRS